MPTQPFRRLLETVRDDAALKKFGGPVKDADALLQPESLVQLDARYDGAYAVFIYDPAVDSGVKQYVAGRGIANDSGAELMVLYEPAPVNKPVAGLSGTAGLGDVVEESPMLHFLRELFPNELLELPGVVLVRRLATPESPVYVRLDGLKSVATLSPRIRNVFGHAVNAIKGRKDAEDYAAALGRGLALDGIPYVKGTPKSVGERLLIAARFLWDHRKDIAAAVKAGAKLAHATGAA